MSILSMRGPEFLLLYTALAVLAYMFVAYSIWRRELDVAGAEPRQLRDPYGIAFLRGGADELVRVVSLNLILRGQLRLQDLTLSATGSSADPAAAVPIETAVLNACKVPVRVTDLPRSAAVHLCIAQYERDLIQAGLVADDDVKRARFQLAALVMAGLVALALLKMQVALSTGHSNIGFLVILMVVSVIALLAQIARRLTAAGRRSLMQLRGLFADLRGRSLSSPTASGDDFALLAAVYGTYGVPGSEVSALGRSPSNGGGDAGGGGGCGGGGGGCGGCGGD